MNFDRVLQAEPPPHRELIRGNCSDLMCPSYSQPVFPGLTRNPVTLATSNCPYHRNFWIPAPDRAGGRLFAGMTGCGGTSY